MTLQRAAESSLPCTVCGSSDIRRSRRQGWFEAAKMAIGDYPFRCLACGARFEGNIWLHAAARHAICPKCLHFALTLHVRRASRLSFLDKFLTMLGAHQYRCEPCRHNFLSFYARRPGQDVKMAPANP